MEGSREEGTELDKKAIASAFSSHKFASTYGYLANDIEWTVIGERVIRGKADIVKTCEDSAAYLSNVKTTFLKFRTFAGESSVVIDSLAEYVDEQDEKSVVASCDIYEFDGEYLTAITSYAVEIPPES